mgnify:CR=1 FL=1
MVGFALARSEHQDGSRVGVANFAADIETIHAWQHQVEDDEIGLRMKDRLRGNVPRCDVRKLETLLAEILDQQLGELVVVFDDEQMCLVGLHCAQGIDKHIPSARRGTLRFATKRSQESTDSGLGRLYGSPITPQPPR